MTQAGAGEEWDNTHLDLNVSIRIHPALTVGIVEFVMNVIGAEYYFTIEK